MRRWFKRKKEEEPRNESTSPLLPEEESAGESEGQISSSAEEARSPEIPETAAADAAQVPATDIVQLLGLFAQAPMLEDAHHQASHALLGGNTAVDCILHGFIYPNADIHKAHESYAALVWPSW